MALVSTKSTTETDECINHIGSLCRSAWWIKIVSLTCERRDGRKAGIRKRGNRVRKFGLSGRCQDKLTRSRYCRCLFVSINVEYTRTTIQALLRYQNSILPKCCPFYSEVSSVARPLIVNYALSIIVTNKSVK